MDEHGLVQVAAADGVVGPTHDWQARCVCGWMSHPWRSPGAAAQEHRAHRRTVVAVLRSA